MTTLKANRSQPLVFYLRKVAKAIVALTLYSWWAIQRQEFTKIWIGDSHALYISIGRHPNFSLWARQRDLCFWLGPRLCYSVARRGFGLNTFQRILLRIVPRERNYVFVLGEIDCRMYLGGHEGQENRSEIWVEQYCVRIEELLANKSPRSIIVLGPTPPCDLGPVIKEYPRRGSIHERVEATKWLNDVLLLEVLKRGARWKFIDQLGLLSTTQGTLSAQGTDDGLHVNSLGAAKIVDSVCQVAQIGGRGRGE